MLSSYAISRKFTSSNPIKELRREKNIQLQELYEFATDREDNVYWSDGVIKKPFKKSPRLMDVKYVDSVHTRMTVETICKEDTFVTGDYIYVDDCYWLCLNSHMFHGMYCRGLFQKCNNILRWQNRTTLKIIERPAIILNATKYGVGQEFGQQVEIPTGSRQIQVRYDEETILLDSPMRLFIDRNKTHPNVYSITQNDNTSVNYGNGIINIVCQDSEYNKKTDSIEKWICDYIPPSRHIKKEHYVGKIIGRDDLRYNERKLYSAKIYKDKELIEDNSVDYNWNIISDFNESIKQELQDGKLYLTILNNDHIGESFVLQLKINGYIYSELKINIVDIY